MIFCAMRTIHTSPYIEWPNVKFTQHVYHLNVPQLCNTVHYKQMHSIEFYIVCSPCHGKCNIFLRFVMTLCQVLESVQVHTLQTPRHIHVTSKHSAEVNGACLVVGLEQKALLGFPKCYLTNC